MARNTPEFRALMGQRESDDDGFTYRYGRHKGGFVKKPRHSQGIDVSKRNDKRSIRGRELRRLALEAVE